MKKKPDHTKRRVILFGTLVLLLILVAAFSGWIVPHDPYVQDLGNALMPPSAEHWFGTDRYGRDLWSRVLVGAKTSIFSSLTVVAIITVTGTVAGTLCGYAGGRMDAVLMRISDVFLAFPGIVFAIAVASVLPGGVSSAVIALSVVSWPKYARIARSQVLAIRDMPFLAAAKLSGSNPAQIIVRHVLPNIAGQMIVTAVLDIGTMMMEIAGLSFLGLGATPPIAEWGAMMSNGRSMLQTAPWVVAAPGVAIFLSVMIFNLFGDAVRDALEPGQ